MSHYVDITFDCLPFRSVGRMDIPLDASPKFRARCERVKQLLERHGSHNVYYLYNAGCIFHLTNEPGEGMVEFQFDGVVLTDPTDQETLEADLAVELVRETCDWLTEPVVHWFAESVAHSVKVEFNRYIAAGDLAQTKERLARLAAEADEHGGFMGMYL